MVTNLKEPIYKKIKGHVTHQGIGGKEIRLEKEMIFDDVFSQNTIAAQQFIERRHDILKLGLINDKQIEEVRQGKYTLEEFNQRWEDFFDNFKIYYGHVEGFGYFVGEDELEGGKDVKLD